MSLTIFTWTAKFQLLTLFNIRHYFDYVYPSLLIEYSIHTPAYMLQSIV